MNDLVKFPGGGLPATADDLAKGLQNVQSTMGPSSGGTPYLRLGKDGIWVYGQENIEVEEGSKWAVNPYSMQHGFAAWGDGELLGESMVPMTQNPPPKSELPDYGVEWKSQLGVMLQCLSGEDKGQVVFYKSTSLGMQNAVRDLNNAIMAQIAVDKTNFVPVVLLEVDSYKHKKYGTIYTPLLDIVAWVSMETGESAESDEEAGDEPDETATADEPEEKPTRRRGKSKTAPKDVPEDDPESVPEDEPEGKPAEKPTRRRRRR